MPKYHVHVYREMKLRFDEIDACSAREAAEKVCDRPLNEADDIDDCDGETFSALVDLVDDEEYEHSRTFDCEPERKRKLAAELLASLEDMVGLQFSLVAPHPESRAAQMIAKANAVVAKAKR